MLFTMLYKLVRSKIYLSPENPLSVLALVRYLQDVYELVVWYSTRREMRAIFVVLRFYVCCILFCWTNPQKLSNMVKSCSIIKDNLFMPYMMKSQFWFENDIQSCCNCTARWAYFSLLIPNVFTNHLFQFHTK